MTGKPKKRPTYSYLAGFREKSETLWENVWDDDTFEVLEFANPPVSPVKEAEIKFTACESGPYPWVPENCLQLNGKFLNIVEYEDSPCGKGWIGRTGKGEQVFYGHDGTKFIIDKKNPAKHYQMSLGL